MRRRACSVSYFVYQSLGSEFLPEFDEGAFVLDYFTPPGTSLAETDRILKHVEEMLKDTPEVESYSRRTGLQLGLFITEPNTGDFLVKLKPDRKRSTEEVKDDLRKEIASTEPGARSRRVAGNPRRPDRRFDQRASADRDKTLQRRRQGASPKGRRNRRA